MPAMCLQTLGSYTPIFLFASFAYLAALLVVHLIVPDLPSGPDIASRPEIEPHAPSAS